MSRINLVELLPYIDPAACSYEEWLQVGMGLQAEGFPLEAWDGWSQNDPQRYHLGECARKWAGFRGTRTPSQELPSPRWPKPMDGTARKRNPES